MKKRAKAPMSKPQSQYFYDHKGFVEACQTLKKRSPAAAKDLVKIGDDWLKGIFNHESGPRDRVDPKRRLDLSVPRQKYLPYLAWASGISGKDKYLKYARARFLEYYKHLGDFEKRSPGDKRSLFAGPETGKLLEYFCLYHAALDPEKTDRDLMNKLEACMMQYAGLLADKTPDWFFSNVMYFKWFGAFCVALHLPEWERSAEVRKVLLPKLFTSIRTQFRKDGGHLEQCANYGRAVIRTTSKLLLLCRKNGIRIPKDIEEIHHNSGIAMLQYSDGNGKLFDFGDSNQRTPFDWGMAWWNLGLRENRKYHLKDKSHFSWNILGLYNQHTSKNRKRVLKPETHLLKDSGYAYLRTDDLKTSMAFDCGVHGHYHGNYDLLSIILSSKGRMLLPDPGIAAYDFSPVRQAALATFSHSTMSIDAENHNSWEDDEKALGKISTWKITKKEIRVSGWHDGYAHKTGAPRLYRDISFDRKNTFVIRDRFVCRSNKKREREFACCTTFNLPDPNKFKLAKDFSSLRTTFAKGPNLEICIENPERIDHISILPGQFHNGEKVCETKKLALVSNGYKVEHLTRLKVIG